ncbi:acyltransferase [Bifidobacterium sp. ESL0798]|uniref:acyltransferase family protein n=1 Tax=Bifidobacterium sp. ESL0798 TaxID=2983235 RepID=UPI0023F6AB1D|nr:acyltransferase [Bifidobacterium sp. ESL0798]WEV73874.1 acyltransferase [Bifidobacterium sp. ESL0798]
MPNTRKTRNLNVEVLRIVAMFLIVACHGILHIHWMLNVDQGFTFKPGWRYALSYLVVQYGQVGVTIFFIISGYFLVTKKFNWTRIFKTWFQMFCYSLLILAVIALVAAFAKPGGIVPLFQGDNLVTTLVWNFFPFLYDSYWFITAYIAMLLLLPFLNCLFDNLQEKYINALIMLLALFSIWILFFGRVSPWDNVTYAILGYLIGGWIRNYSKNHPRMLQTKYLIVAILLSTAGMAAFNYISANGSHLVGLLGWQSQTKQGIQILPMIVAAAVFILVDRINMSGMPKILRNFVLKLAASTFGVYLLHENMFLYRLIWPAMTSLFPTPTSIVSTVLIFIAIIVIVYLAMSLIAFLLDTCIVHPLENVILRKEATHKNPKSVETA